MRIRRIAELLQFSHRELVAMHDSDEVSQIWLGDPLRSNVQEASLDAFHAGDL